ncbi:MAG: translation elongation factor Ts [Chloroflexi bacterium]|nr:translation elongation factor Ts [Chloroflexota bacterium]
MSISAEQIKKIRELTGAGVLDAKKTLEQFNGDFEKALAVLKEKGLKSAEKKAERVAKQGLIETYLHGVGKIGVMVEVNCETDFVAATNDFKELTHDIALQIAATKPQFVSPEEIPAAKIEEMKKAFTDAAVADKKPANIIEKIVTGKLEAFYKEACLLRQPFIKDDTQTIYDRIQLAIAKLGENIVVKRFVRFELGE